MTPLLDELHRKTERTQLGGGPKKIEDQHRKGKLTARERIEYLIDDNASFIEIGLFVGEGMYAEHGGCPSGGVVVGMWATCREGSV
jgi:3-methylcrotonyl-CoA carboxylase beta subunit